MLWSSLLPCVWCTPRVKADPTAGSDDLLDISPEVDQPAVRNQLELVNTGSEPPHNQHPSPVTAQSETVMGNPLVSGGTGQMKPTNDTPTPNGTGKNIPAVSKGEDQTSTPDVVRANTSKGDTPASKVQTPTTKEDTLTTKEDTPTSREDPPTPKEDPPTSREDPPTPKEDTPSPSEDPPAPNEDTPPAKPQDLESWKGI